MAARTYAILRVRPLSIMAEGFPEARLRVIARSFAGDDPVDGPSETFPVPPDVEAFDAETISGLTGWLTSLTEGSDILLVDMDYDRTSGRYAVADILLYQAMVRLADANLRGKQILVMVNERLAPTDDLALLAEDERFRDSVIIVDSAGNITSTEPPTWFEEAEDPEWISLRELRKTLTGKLLRSRGIFTSQTQPNEYSMFYYSAANCEFELQMLIAAYLVDRGVDFVIYDHLGSDWFQSAVKAACFEEGKRAYTIDDFIGSVAGERALETVAENAAQDLADPDKRFAILTPAYKTGRRISHLWHACQDHGRADSLFLTVLCDLSGDAGADAQESGVYGTVSVPLDNNDVELDYFAAVGIKLLPEASWQVQAAKLANEIESMSGTRRRPTSVAMLTLFADYGSDNEYEVPPTRPGIRAFPQLRDLDAWDSLWLAEALVTAVEQELGCRRGELVVVAPDEGTAIRPITDAVERHLVVAVAKISRSIINDELAAPEKAAKMIRRYQKIALLDESAVTYTTLHKLDRIVREVIGRSADISASVIELPVGKTQRPENMLSLIRWNPLLFTRRRRKNA